MELTLWKNIIKTIVKEQLYAIIIPIFRFQTFVFEEYFFLLWAAALIFDLVQREGSDQLFNQKKIEVSISNVENNALSTLLIKMCLVN